MKSAYEIAMEKMAKSGSPSKSLTDEQRERLAQIDQTYDARIAEKRLEFDTKISAASTPDELDALRDAMNAEVRALEDKREAEKDAIWNEA